MAYTEINFKTKKDLKTAIKEGKRLRVYQPNNIYNIEFKPGETVYLKGPHYPQSHKWYGTAKLGADGCIDTIK